MTQTTVGRVLPMPIIALLLALLLWSSSFTALTCAFRTYVPLVVIFARMFIATICFLIVAKRITNSLQYRNGDYKPLVFMAICEPCLYFLFEAQAVVNTSAAQAGVITAILPILVMIAAAIFLKERCGMKTWVGALIAVAGVCWLTIKSTPSADAPNPVLGNFLEFLAMVCATGSTISLKALTTRYSPWLLTAIQAFIGSIFYFPLLFLPTTNLPETFHWGATLAIVYLGSFITLGAYGFYNYGVKYIEASKAASFVNLIPVFSVILAWFFLGETFSLQQIFAATLIISGVYLSQQ